jgi:hypothetical protein
MGLHGPPKRASDERCTIRCCIGKKKPRGKVFSSLQRKHRCRFVQVLSDGLKYLLGTKLAEEKAQLC